MDILSLLFQKKVLALLLFTTISIVAAIIIVLYQKKPKIKEEKEESYSDRIRTLFRNKNAGQKLAVLDSIFKEFLAKKYNIHEKLDFYEIEKKFEKNKEISDFCKLMIEAYYYGKEVTESTIERNKQNLERIINEKKQPEHSEKKFFSFFRPVEKKYYVKGENIPSAPEPKVKIKETKENKKENTQIKHGRDHQNNLSVFAHKEKAAEAKHNIHHAKHHLKNIHHSISHSKQGTLNENLSISEWANSLGEVKSEIIEDCKKVLSKV